MLFAKFLVNFLHDLLLPRTVSLDCYCTTLQTKINNLFSASMELYSFFLLLHAIYPCEFPKESLPEIKQKASLNLT